METKPTKEKLSELMRQLQLNGGFCQDLAKDLPSIIAAIPDGEEFELLEKTCREFKIMWVKHPPVAEFWRYLGILAERDRARRLLMVEIEVGQLEAMSELPIPPTQ